MKKILYVIALFLGIALLSPVYGQEKETVVITVKTTFRWEAMNGPMEGTIIPLPEQANASIIFSCQANIADRTFNAKVWKDGSSIPWLAIVTVDYEKNKTLITDENFRFDQAVNERLERFFIVNSSAETLYVRLGGKEVMLKPGGRSRKIEAYMGWYYLEVSRKRADGEVEPFSIVIAVADHQKVVDITSKNMK